MSKTRMKPSIPYKYFPLFAHATVQWARNIRGRSCYFRVWSDAEAALKKYLAERDWLQVGEGLPADITGTSLADLCNQFLTAKQSRVHSGELTLATFHDYKRCCDLLIKTLGRQRPVQVQVLSLALCFLNGLQWVATSLFSL
ncbi:MAG: hypothetical protein KDA86_26560 [Planctomycetaceae bacterium]|nr:hypothetical protein [Planctomycetaceae bacterium]